METIDLFNVKVNGYTFKSLTQNIIKEIKGGDYFRFRIQQNHKLTRVGTCENEEFGKGYIIQSILTNQYYLRFENLKETYIKIDLF